MSFLTDTSYDPTAGTFRILSSKVVDSYRLFNERLLFFGAMISWLGFRTSTIEVSHNERASGSTTYSFRKKVNLGIIGILSFSDKPLKIILAGGFIISTIATCFILYKVILNMLYGTSALGWSSLIAAIGFSTGLLVIVIGVVGIYVGNIFKEVKQRPKYVCSELINLDSKSFK